MISAPEETRRARYGLALVVPMLLLGFLIAAQWQTQGSRTPFAGRYQVTLAEAAVDLQREHDALRDQLAELRGELDAVLADAARHDVRSAALRGDLETLKAAAGLTERSGAGVTVTLDDARLPASTPRRTLELAIIHSTDITDVINAAWKAGAEAISVNGERITVASACVGAVIQINGTLLSPPFVVRALGPRDRLYAALTDAGELRDLKARRDAFGLGLRIERADQLTVPAYTGPIAVRYASVR